MANVVAEAMASGLPCVLTPQAGLPDDFGTPGRHYVPSEDHPAELAEAILSLLLDPGRRTALGLAGRDLTARVLDVERSLDQYAVLYRSTGGRSRNVK
jgi:glycosyltransferase involved in cell wall biosynthesis